MRPKRPLLRLLAGFLRRSLLHRTLAWGAFAILVLTLGSLALMPFGYPLFGRMVLLMGVAAAWPVFLLWPLSPEPLLRRLRDLDAHMVFEAYLESEPGPTRDLLAIRMAERVATLILDPLPKARFPKGLKAWCLASLACLVVTQAASWLWRGRMLTLSPDPVPAAEQAGQRIEDEGFSDFASEDPEARRLRRERALEAKAREHGDNAPGTAGRTAEGSRASRRTPGATLPSDLADKIAKRKMGEPEDSAGQGTESPSASSDLSGKGTRAQADLSRPGELPEPRPAPGRSAPGGSDPGGTRPPMQPGPGRQGQGYEHTPNTQVASPLRDYRARFEARYAERTGKHVAASGALEAGELRAFQRQYFDSFNLRVEVGTGEDAHVALLKRRWRERQGGQP